MERHRHLKLIARILFVMPGMKPAARVLTRLAIQNLPLSLKSKQRLYNLFASNTAPEGSVTCSIKSPHGKTIKLKLNMQDEYLSRLWYYWGYAGFENTTHLFDKLLKTKSCVFDIGANIGYFTLLAASVMEGRGAVHAFEPHPEVFNGLMNNSSLNGFRCLRVNQLAMSDRDGQERFFLPSNRAWTNASLIEGFTDQQEPIIIDTVRFDSYCGKHSIRAVDLVKIDVEGAELKVLRGMGGLLDAWLPDIICEVLQPYEAELDQFFRHKAYRKFLITDKGLEEVDRIKAHPHFRDYYLSRSPVSLGEV